MIPKTLVTLIFIGCTVVAGGVCAQGYPWRDHDGNYAFLFGNDFDSHQQTRLTPSGGLAGFFYVRYTGEVTIDGYPVAVHADCNQVGDCRVGWILRGEPGRAIFLYHSMGDHPTWKVERADIPQPGAFSHFHFVGAHPTQTGETRDGYFLQLQAVDHFCFVHHDVGTGSASCREIDGVPVNAGIDIATHVNIVGSAPMPMSN
jgi:hypothetical protein